MNIDFSSKRLADASLSLLEAIRLFGVPIGRKYVQRIAVLRAVDKFTHLFGLKALHLHPLKRHLAGKYAITLTGNYRLIIEKIEEDAVIILDVEDYHGN